VTQGSAALPLSACCAVRHPTFSKSLIVIEENSCAFVCLNISNIILTHKYTQQTQLHA